MCSGCFLLRNFNGVSTPWVPESSRQTLEINIWIMLVPSVGDCFRKCRDKSANLVIKSSSVHHLEHHPPPSPQLCGGSIFSHRGHCSSVRRASRAKFMAILQAFRNCRWVGICLRGSSLGYVFRIGPAFMSIISAMKCGPFLEGIPQPYP